MTQNKSHPMVQENIWVPREIQENTLNNLKPPDAPRASIHPQKSGQQYQPMYVMWVNKSEDNKTTTRKHCTQKIWRYFYLIARPTLSALGQCTLGLAILFIISGIALCIWGYVGTPIKIFQTIGPISVSIGCLIYFCGCFMCCREYPVFERTLRQKQQEERTKQAVSFLNNADVIDYIQGENELYEEFAAVAKRILHNNGLESSPETEMTSSTTVHNLSKSATHTLI